MAAWKAALLVCLVKFGKQLRERKVNYLPSQVKGANPAPASAPSFNPLRTVNVADFRTADRLPHAVCFRDPVAINQEYPQPKRMPGGQQRLVQIRHSRDDLRPGTAAPDDRDHDTAGPPIHLRHVLGQLLSHSHSSNVPAGISHSSGNACRPAKSRQSPRWPSWWLVILTLPDRKS